ncbi:L-ribulose-5-phosphate 3-epimerase [Actinotalea ferrariae]|uniref:L-ribulose-5-phosphate 3-epimerase n=1 Tax=Actinotalea ferrariae TaxID=1386098 RepID=UPI001C8C0F09|nr:L-ribulose-5-phosphate 3-epimerase [Actinotalea ferrariae]MBX9244154.1 L-ribulose-5-phosphate 3-epimerase [Actinotalea ferrariae]
MIRRHGVANLVGVYEKALLPGTPGELAVAAAEAGYDFLELAVDETPERMTRLGWSTSERGAVRRRVTAAGVPIGTVVLSAHRRSPWGSADRAVRSEAARLARQSIDLAADVGAGCVQVAGYFTYYEPTGPSSRGWFLDGLATAAAHAAERGVVLALENMDGTDVRSVEEALAVVREVPGVRLYVDVGNLAGNGLDVVGQLAAALPHTHAVQLKDARPGLFRRVPFGEGTVPFGDVLALLDAVGYTRPLSVEMWNDDGDPALAADARRWLQAAADEALAAADHGHDCSCQAG